ncbi:unnamed protein product [Ilex paraguariensis]|uniref:WPP domain-associated protein n=1 Tax=Ilex paraguariensis TaxID=185542 RepID=A0ABC8RDV4_9AQUA
MESVGVSNGSDNSYIDGLKQVGSGVKENENLGDKILEDFDSYLHEEINNRLTISRMVGDSVIKGIVNAVEQEAAEKITAKELEMTGLKESLKFFDAGTDKIELLTSPLMHYGPESINRAQYVCRMDAFVEHDRMSKCLGSLRNVAKDQFMKLKKEIDGLRGCIPIRRIGSGQELVGLSGILIEKDSESWVGVDRRINALKTTVDTICMQADDMLLLSKASLCKWQQEQEVQGLLEAMVMQSAIRSLQEEFEEKLWDQSSQSCGAQCVNWLEKFNEISSLCKELDAIVKLLSNSETGQLISHVSRDVDHLERKTLGNNGSTSSSLSEENGKLEGSKTDVPESFDAAQLKHLSKDDMVTNFNTMMTMMRRSHDSAMQEQTEKYYILKREYLKLRDVGSSLPFKKDKEFDILKKKIPEVILKLDDILVENEKLLAFGNNAESLGNLKDRLDSLLSENRQLRYSLTDKKNEVKCLSSKVSDAGEKILQHSLTEGNMIKWIQNLNSAVEDSHVEASIREEVYRCVSRELSGQIRCDTQESEMDFNMMPENYGIIRSEAAHNAKSSGKCAVEDSDMELSIVQEVLGVMFGEAMKDAEGKLEELYGEYLVEYISRISLETKTLENVNELRLEVTEKEGLKQELLLLEMSMKEKEKRVLELSATLLKQGEQLELASQELNNLRGYESQQQTIISKSNKELDLLKCQLEIALEQNEVDNVEIDKLNQKLEQAMDELSATLLKQGEQLELAYQELNNLRGYASQQQTIISESNKELDLLKSQLEQNEVHNVEIDKLNQKLEQAMEELKEANQQKKVILTLTQEKQSILLSVEAKEKEHKKQMETVNVLVHGLSKMIADFECRVAEDIRKNNIRLQCLKSQLSSLIQQACLLRNRGLMYKQRLERRCSDLQKAEAEVDLLGDEVDTLSSLLEKIYIALDHYSPILHHYPGIVETLKLVRRELSGESIKAV